MMENINNTNIQKEKNSTEGRWYKADVLAAHLSKYNTHSDKPVYLFAESLEEAQIILAKKVRGWKKNKPYSLHEVNEDEYELMMERIEERDLDYKFLQKQGFFYGQENTSSHPNRNKKKGNLL